MTAPQLAPAPPIADRDSAFFWEGLRSGRLLVQRCSACARHRFPPLPGCPWCGDPGAEIEAVGGSGALYSWVVVHHAFSEAFEADVPYTVATVELDEGCRMLARLEVDGEPQFGMRLAVRFREHAAPAPGDSAWTEAYFCAAGATE